MLFKDFCLCMYFTLRDCKMDGWEKDDLRALPTLFGFGHVLVFDT